MSAQTPGVLVRASAGTGKTHRLAVRCIELIARGEPLDAILATTFTRKAAGEIRERVLAMLASAAQGERRMIEALGEHIAGFDSDRARTLLADAVSRLHRVQIMTIDALAARMATMVELEIGLPPGWSIMDDLDDRALRARALERSVERSGAEAMLPLLHDLHDGAAKSSVHAAMLGVVKNGEAAWRAAKGDARVWDTVPLLPGALDEGALASAIEVVARAPMTVTTKTGKPDSRWAKAHAGAVEAAVQHDWDRLVGGGLGAIAEDGTYYGHTMPEDMRAAYLPVVRHAAAVIVRRHIVRTRALEAIIARFVPEYDAMKREAGVVRFEDVPRLLAHGIDASTREAMYYRLDTRIRHVLLDEFQDTSAEQFELVEPMIAEIVSTAPEGRSTLIVGDPKQTLYSWRNAAPGLMDEVTRRWPEGFRSDTMELSRRSSPAVLEAVNRVFASLEDAPVVGASRAAREMQGGFREHASAKPWLPGAARVRELGEPEPRTDDERENPPPAWALCAADLVQEIHRDHPSWTIGVLTRKGKTAGRIISVLHGRGVFASAERGTELGDAPAAAAFAALLTLIDHPGHSVAAYLVAMSPVGRAVGIDGFAASDRLHRTIDGLRQRIADHGAADLAAEVLRRIAPDTDDRGLRRFEQVVEMCERFDRAPADRVAALADRIWTVPVDDPSASGIRVMTVHASKGLEFDAVVLPELGDAWRVRPGDVLLDQPDPIAPPRAVSAYASDLVRSLSPEIDAIHAATLERRYVDELCALYVAMTRAKSRVEMIVPPMTKGEAEGKDVSSATAARVLRAALAADQPAGEGGLLWECVHTGDPDRAAREAHATNRALGAPRATPAPRFVVGRGDQPAWRMDRRSPSMAHEGEGPRTRRSVDTDGGIGARVGDLVHAWFERIGWIEDGLPTESELDAIGASSTLDPAIVASMRERFHAAAQSEAFATVLSRDAVHRRFGGAEVEVRPEMPFLVRDAALLSGRFDRVMIGREGGLPTSIEIVDFKTDTVGEDRAAWIAERIEAHRVQMEMYRRAASRVMRVPVERVRVWLAMVAAAEVVEVVPADQ